MAASDSIKSSVTSQASSRSTQSAKNKKKSIFSIFGPRSSPGSGKSRRSSTSSDRPGILQDLEEDDTSDDDKSIDLNTYQAAVAPLSFKPFKTHTKKHLNESTDLSERLHMMLDDEDYEKYLRQPKHLKTFRKSHKTAPICKRLFLAQELSQDINSSDPMAIDQMVDGIRLDDPEARSETFSSTLMNTSLSINRTNIFTESTKEPKVDACDKMNAVWAMKFSLDGKFLATAGKGSAIHIWKVIGSPLDRLQENVMDGDENLSHTDADDNKKMAYASVFQDLPYRSYYGHTHDTLSLDWSKNNFLLSSSMDKTVKLWNVQQNKCLRTFQHNDFVPSVKFHPTDDRFFVSGCLDHKVRLWSILEGEVKYEFDAKNLVTAVALTPNGTITIAGTFKGMVYFLDTQTLELRHSLELNKKKNENTKITGIECYNDGEDVKVVITSNDSRIRILSLRNKCMEYYLKGLDNNSSQIIATVSSDNKYIISGSENHWLYVWEIHNDSDKKNADSSSSHRGNGNNGHGLLGLVANKKKKRADYTSFHAHHHIITCALIAPSGTFKALSLSNDYIYELNSQLRNYTFADDAEGIHKKVNNEKASSLINNDCIGGIIVTADDHGVIRVFRQDFPSSIRKTLLTEKKRRDTQKDSHQQLQNQHQHYESMAHRTSLLNKAFNGSSHSLSRGNSMRTPTTRGNGVNTSTAVSPDRTPQLGRSRSGTNDELTPQRLKAHSGTQSQKKLTCDVCGGEKFAVSKGSSSGFDVFCTDCGNQMKT